MAKSTQFRQSGSTLLEVLVAIVVLSFGLLGMAGLQAASLKSNQTALQRSQAVVLAYDIMDRMRSNYKEARAGEYLHLLDDPKPSAGGNLAKRDLNLWLTRLTDVLGADAQGQVCVTPVQGGIKACIPWTEASAVRDSTFVQVTVQWQGRELASDDASGVVQTINVVGRVW